jgi:hypothetical protein
VLLPTLPSALPYNAVLDMHIDSHVHTHRHKSGVALSCGTPFKAVLSTCYYAIPLKGFSHSSPCPLTKVIAVGWVEAIAKTHHLRRHPLMGFATLYPPYTGCPRGPSALDIWLKQLRRRSDGYQVLFGDTAGKSGVFLSVAIAGSLDQTL